MTRRDRRRAAVLSSLLTLILAAGLLGLAGVMVAGSAATLFVALAWLLGGAA